MENVCRFVRLVQWPFILRPLDNTHLKLIFEMLVQRILNVTYVYKHKKYRFSSLQTSSQLNLEPQKSKIPLGRSGSLKGRRKPTAAARRKSLKSGVTDDWDDTNAISEEDDS